MAAAGRKILIVDDETALLDLMATYLTRLGYDVDSCRSSHSALALFNERPSSYALLIADVQMPGITGPELAARARELNPDVCVLLTSGHSPEQIPLPSGPPCGTRLLPKPFSPWQLSEAVRSLLGG